VAPKAPVSLYLFRRLGARTFVPLKPASRDVDSLCMNGYQAYRQTQAQTAAPGELVVMLYRGALRFVAAAAEAIDTRDIQTAHTNLIRAQAIISELNETLDLTRGGELASNLQAIYTYMSRRLIEANLRKDASAAREVEGLLRELLPAWEQAAREAASASAVAA
jgi:flagellar secretion chaperone FliS